jgi:hypothetical protein
MDRAIVNFSGESSNIVVGVIKANRSNEDKPFRFIDVGARRSLGLPANAAAECGVLWKYEQNP